MNSTSILLEEISTTYRVTFTYLCIALSMFISAGGGIGGGCVIVPILMSIMNMQTNEAIPLSNMTVVGGAIINFYLCYQKKYPNSNRRLVNLDFVIIAQPLSIAGALIGTYFNKIAPDWLLSILLLILLITVGIRTIRKARELDSISYKYLPLNEKTNLLKSNETELTQKQDNQNHYEKSKEKEITKEPLTQRPSSSGIEVEVLQRKLKELLDEEKRKPKKQLIQLSFLLLFIVICTIAKGGKRFNPLNMECPSLRYWIVAFLPFPLLIIFSYKKTNEILVKLESNRRDYDKIDDEFEWSRKKLLVVPLFCFIAGIFAGAFGLGGGILFAPLMLELGMIPSAAAATTATMVFFTSSTSAISFLIFGDENYNYVIQLFLIGMLSTFFGQTLSSRLVERFQRPSLLVYSCGIIIIAAVFALGYKSIVIISNRIYYGPQITSISIC